MLNNTSFNASAQGDQPNLCTYVILFKHIAKYIQCTGEQLSIANTHWYVLHAPVHWVVEILKRRIANTDPVHYWRWSATLGNCCQAVFPIVDIFLHSNSSLYLVYSYKTHQHTLAHAGTKQQQMHTLGNCRQAIFPISDICSWHRLPSKQNCRSLANCWLASLVPPKSQHLPERHLVV